MIDYFSQCITENCQMLPISAYAWLGTVLCLVTVLLWVFLGFRKGARWAAGLLLVSYLFWICCMTVIFRDVQSAQSFNLNPFWSYREIKAGDSLLLVQDIMNAVAFIPVGLLLGCFNGRMRWWKVLLVGLVISLSIEFLQFILQRGFAEFDDVFHNTLGSLIGFWVYKGLSSLKTRVQEKDY